MGKVQRPESSVGIREVGHLRADRRKTCDALRVAIDEGKIGDIVANHEQMILDYYEDVQDQAKLSFKTARSAAIVGFMVLILTLLYALLLDARSRFDVRSDTTGTVASKTVTNEKATGTNEEVTTGKVVAVVGVVSGFLIEFISGVAFWLYSRSARQFGAFHICLERTHRYLIAYKIAEQIQDKKDDTLRDLVCIMANAPMITRDDIDSAGVGGAVIRNTQAKVMSVDVTKAQAR